MGRARQGGREGPAPDGAGTAAEAGQAADAERSGGQTEGGGEGWAGKQGRRPRQGRSWQEGNWVVRGDRQGVIPSASPNYEERGNRRCQRATAGRTTAGPFLFR